MLYNIDEINKPGSYIKANGIYYPGAIRSIKKSPDPFQALWEAITNALESINDNYSSSSYVHIRFFYTTDLIGSRKLEKIEIEDNGPGFTDTNFERIIQLGDDRKSSRNRGSGRVQMIHTFKLVNVESIYQQSGNFYKRSMVLSKRPEFMENNAILFYNSKTEEAGLSSPKTIFSFSAPYDEHTVYENLNLPSFKATLFNHYLPFFCSIRYRMPKIQLSLLVDSKEVEHLAITQSEIPLEDQTFDIEINYSQFSPKKNAVEQLQENEKFTLRCFKLAKTILDKNAVTIVCKNEVIDKPALEFELLKPDGKIDDMRYLVFVSGQYFDDLVGNTRGELQIPTEKDLQKDNQKLYSKCIVLDNISKATNHAFKVHYPEVERQEKKYLSNLERLRSMFLLSDSTISSLSGKFGIGFSEESILKSIYEADSALAAKSDAKIKKIVDSLDDLKPTAKNYQQQLHSKIDSLVELIPMQNRVDITHYVARRKLVLEIFQKALDHELKMQKEGTINIDEKILHNILFQQSSKDPNNSDLWLINEDFIYFNGCSEERLFDVTIDDEKIFRDEFSEIEEQYLLSLKQDRRKKRPDVLLFPDEGKCIIIEFKNPDVDVSDYIHQAHKYASWIGTYTKDKYEITTFYSYLIGESIEDNDVFAVDATFQSATHFKYLFKPPFQIFRGENRKKGYMYSEIIKFSVLLERAILRNKIFIDKLMKHDKSQQS